MTSCAGIWTDGRVTVVLANVCVAYWAKAETQRSPMAVWPT
jgi:hypothetical protein